MFALPAFLLALLPQTPVSPAPVAASAVLEHAAPEARAAWERLVAASGSPERAPITAFHLHAEVRARTGVQTNDAEVDYSYLAPDCMRFMLPSLNETGRFGPAPEQYWLKSKDGLLVLSGREFKEDRRQVDDMLALAKNYVALSNPGRVNLLALELMSAPPPDLGVELAKKTKKLTWLALESPDFALVRRETAGAVPGIYRVELGLRQDGLPAVAIVREKRTGGGDPLLVELGQYEERDGFKIPLQLLVHVLDRALAPVAFATDAAQEIYVKAAELRPTLTSADFQPKK